MPFPIKKKQAILFDIRFELLAQINSNQFKFARETIIIPSFFFFVEAETSQNFTLSKKFPKLVPPSAIIDQSLSTQLVSPHVRVIKGLASNPWKFPFPSPSPPSPDRHHFASSPPRKSCYVPFSRRFPSLQSPPFPSLALVGRVFAPRPRTRRYFARRSAAPLHFHVFLCPSHRSHGVFLSAASDTRRSSRRGSTGRTRTEAAREEEGGERGREGGEEDGEATSSKRVLREPNVSCGRSSIVVGLMFIDNFFYDLYL